MSPSAEGRTAKSGAFPPCALEMTINPSATNGVGIGMSPPPRKRHSSLPVAKSYEMMNGQPLVTTCVLAPSLWINGVPQLPSQSPLREVLHNSFPSERLKAATNGSLGSSQRSTMRSLYSAGELLYPHPMPCQLLLMIPRSFDQSSLPSRSKQYRPSEPKKPTNLWPSVISVVFACVDFSCLSVNGLAVRITRSQRRLPVFL